MSLTALWSPPDSAAELSDSQLLELFLQTGLGQKTRSDWAMTELIERHSPMVLAACARSLRNRSGAEDAAQTVFLLLWKKAATLTKTAHSLGGWLHRTAVLVCKNANREAQNRQKYEQQAAAMMSQQTPDPVDWAAVREVIDVELDQLPDKYRVPLVLYHLEGRSVSEVAAALTAAEATVGTWLARGRELLADRLMRRGLGLGAAALAVGLSSAVSAAAPPAGFAAATVTVATIASQGTSVAAAGATGGTALGAKLLSQHWGQIVLTLVILAGVIALWRYYESMEKPERDSFVSETSPPPPGVSVSPLTRPDEVLADFVPPIEPETDPLAGAITGQILWEGPLPKLAPLPLRAQGTVPDESVLVDPASLGLKNVFVYLQKAPPGYVSRAAPVRRKVIDHPLGRYSPRASWIRTDEHLVFKNFCAVSVDIHSMPYLNPGSNFILKPWDRLGTVVLFTQSERFPVQIVDDMHASARAYVLPLDHPFASITDAQGRFQIGHLPVGTHQFRVWHERFGYLERAWNVEVVGQTTTALTPLRVSATKLK